MIAQDALRTIERYEIIREVGRGATAVVYLARQRDLDRSVALKELSALRAADAAFTARFVRESRLAGSLNHPNVVTVHEYFEHGGTAYIAMEYLERGSLRPLIGTLTLQQIAGVLEGLLAGLAHAESRRIVHRDLKPENVMVTTGGGVKIADFGIAKAFEPEAGPITLAGETAGTPAYMAPEQALAGEVGPYTDLYAVGVIAYEMLAGEVPFHDSDIPLAIMLQHVNEPAPSLSSVRPDLDSELSDWVARLLAKDPVQRPQSAVEAWDELDETVIRLLGPRWRRQSRLTETRAEAAPAASDAPTAAMRAPPTRKRRPGRARAALLLVVLLFGGLVAGVALAVTLAAAEEPEPTSPTEETTVPVGKPVAAPVLATMRLGRSGEAVTARLGLTGAALATGSVVVRDRDLTDGRAVFELRQRAIRATTAGRKNDAVDIRVRRGKGVLRVEVVTDAGAFAALRVRRVGPHTVVLTLTPPVRTTPPDTNTSPPAVVTEPAGPTSTTPTTTTPATPTKPAEKPPKITTH